jgi:hypothetical protein
VAASAKGRLDRAAPFRFDLRSLLAAVLLHMSDFRLEACFAFFVGHGRCPFRGRRGFVFFGAVPSAALRAKSSGCTAA